MAISVESKRFGVRVFGNGFCRFLEWKRHQEFWVVFPVDGVKKIGDWLEGEALQFKDSFFREKNYQFEARTRRNEKGKFAEIKGGCGKISRCIRIPFGNEGDGWKKVSNLIKSSIKGVVEGSCGIEGSKPDSSGRILVESQPSLTKDGSSKKIRQYVDVVRSNRVSSSPSPSVSASFQCLDRKVAELRAHLEALCEELCLLRQSLGCLNDVNIGNSVGISAMECPENVPPSTELGTSVFSVSYGQALEGDNESFRLDVLREGEDEDLLGSSEVGSRAAGRNSKFSEVAVPETCPSSHVREDDVDRSGSKSGLSGASAEVQESPSNIDGGGAGVNVSSESESSNFPSHGIEGALQIVLGQSCDKVLSSGLGQEGNPGKEIGPRYPQLDREEAFAMLCRGSVFEHLSLETHRKQGLASAMDLEIPSNVELQHPQWSEDNSEPFEHVWINNQCYED